MDRTTNLTTCSARSRQRTVRRFVGLVLPFSLALRERVGVRGRRLLSLAFFVFIFVFSFSLALGPRPVLAQVVGGPPPQVWGPRPQASPEAQRKVQDLIGELVGTDLTMDIDPRRSKILRTKKPVTRVSITNPDVLEVTQFSPTEFELIGTRIGQTNLTLWFAGAGGQGEGEMLRYLVRVFPNQGPEEEQTIEYSELERRINELFPNSSVQLIPVADKLIVRGEARDSREAGEIVAILRGESGEPKAAGAANPACAANPQLAPGALPPAVTWPIRSQAGRQPTGPAANLFPGKSGRRPSTVINMLDVPGEMQVMLKVRVAELSRSALCIFGSQLNLNFGDFSLTSNFGMGGAFSAVLNGKNVQLTIDAIATNSYGKVLLNRTW